MTTITVERVGRRSYLRGNTYPLKDALRGAGAKWDPEQKAWWVGSHEKALELAGTASPAATSESPAAERSSDKLGDDDKIVGKARYKGREYILVWEGNTKRGRAAKLAYSDGAKVFWASEGEYEVTKRYEARERTFRGHTTREDMTFGRLVRLREKFAKAREQGHDDGIVDGQRYECPECGDYAIRGQGSCWETGAAH